jgi:RNA recognition motif-containing protein
VTNIFVGNLGFDTNEDELRQLFAAYGPVNRVTIITDRDTGQSCRFGFEEMSSAADGQKVIAGLNGTLLGDRTLSVTEAHRGAGLTAAVDARNSKPLQPKTGDSHGKRRRSSCSRKPRTGYWAIPALGMYQYRDLQ